jgi:hypothetical protein
VILYPPLSTRDADNVGVVIFVISNDIIIYVNKYNEWLNEYKGIYKMVIRLLDADGIITYSMKNNNNKYNIGYFVWAHHMML